MHETNDLEFKRELTRSYLKTVSAFANYGTGRIVFGVDDGGNKIGLTDVQDACLRIEHAINDSLDPVPDFSLSVNEEANTVTLTVEEGRDKPYLYDGKAYRRANSSTVKVNRLEYNRLVRLGANTSFDALEAAEQELSFSLLEKELVDKTGLLGLDDNALISLELMLPSRKFDNAAALLADSNSFVGTDIARFGESISIILSRHTFEHTSVLAQMEQAIALFDEHYAYEEVVGSQRVSKALVPRQAFREAVANALVHRRWDVAANMKISMFADRIEILSPGGLPDGITEEDYLAGGPSIARNPILANVFFRLGYIERFGTGIPRIIEEYASANVSPSFAVRESSITVTLPVESRVAFSSDESRLLEVLQKGSMLTRAEVEALTGMSKDRVLRILDALREKGIVSKLGSGRSTRYARR